MLSAIRTDDIRGLDERIEKAQNIPSPVGEGVSNFASFVAPEQQSGNDQPAQMLAARPDLNVQFIANLADTEFRMHGQQFENFNAAVVGKSFDDPFQPFAAGPRSTDDAFGCLHPATPLPSPPPVDNIPTFLGMLECFSLIERNFRATDFRPGWRRANVGRR